MSRDMKVAHNPFSRATKALILSAKSELHFRWLAVLVYFLGGIMLDFGWPQNWVENYFVHYGINIFAATGYTVGVTFFVLGAITMTISYYLWMRPVPISDFIIQAICLFVLINLIGAAVFVLGLVHMTIAINQGFGIGSNLFDIWVAAALAAYIYCLTARLITTHTVGIAVPVRVFLVSTVIAAAAMAVNAFINMATTMFASTYTLYVSIVVFAFISAVSLLFTVACYRKFNAPIESLFAPAKVIEPIPDALRELIEEDIAQHKGTSRKQLIENQLPAWVINIIVFVATTPFVGLVAFFRSDIGRTFESFGRSIAQLLS